MFGGFILAIWGSIITFGCFILAFGVRVLRSAV